MTSTTESGNTCTHAHTHERTQPTRHCNSDRVHVDKATLQHVMSLRSYKTTTRKPTFLDPFEWTEPVSAFLSSAAPSAFRLGKTVPRTSTTCSNAAQYQEASAGDIDESLCLKQSVIASTGTRFPDQGQQQSEVFSALVSLLSSTVR